MLWVLQEIIATLWLMLPVYLPNPGAVLFKGRVPIDFGKTFIDGRRILGKGKTWRGFFGGSLFGVIIGLLMNFIAFYAPQEWFPVFSTNWTTATLIVTTMAFSAMLGDSTGSFIKRRLGIGSGGRAFLLDQLMFVIMAWLFLYLFFPWWFFEHFWKLAPVLTVFILTPLIHRGVNILAYKLGYKDVPW